jgi:chromosome segregation ATPase
MQDDNLRAEMSLLERRLNMLLESYKQLKSELELLKKENFELKSSLKTKDNHLNDFQNKIKISKIVNSIHGEGDKLPELRNIIDEYIKEIDKCILHLSK